MSIILAIETSTELASAALLHGDELISRESLGVQTHSETILPMVQQLLAQAGVALSRCDAIAFGVGPGSFTGVRTACGVVQGLAFGSDLPVAPVVTLEAMAQACLEATGGQAKDVLAVLDARMGEVYWAQYRHGADGWQAVLEPVLSTAIDVRPQGLVRACGNGLAAYAKDFAGQAFTVGAMAQLMPHAAQVATLGRGIFEQGRTVALQDAQPLYLRNKVALTTAERRVRDLAKGAA
ncbi:tRNA (adenosine(37)-N6)-threonylcarbamoyltransferase complex dimerization subunit type 1 TsaB [Herbaspirillum sp. RV1423]|uniref:tRNA (adenosine(37)-N6)-threonylcarbamoyltransferase complex dimerization subunit type 1 TsaB n=1 Tax=Herbaspirillum sp. RV1423 TaxID=1443993 RepID=UPI0004BC7617|nr:tRNA (adenosine(37)-N6)-threonylcarbamoyltransferase complex dimerization subunit type 1 TsaB [Herbaspirillum sp. RV1423]